MTASIRNLLLVAWMVVGAGCGQNNELDSKEEYSTLQYFEAEYRSSENTKPYILIKRALGSKYDVFGLPLQGRAKGYVWFIANPDTQPYVKKMPADAMFVLHKNSLATLEKSTQLSPALRDYLGTQAR